MGMRMTIDGQAVFRGGLAGDGADAGDARALEQRLAAHGQEVGDGGATGEGDPIHCFSALEHLANGCAGALGNHAAVGIDYIDERTALAEGGGHDIPGHLRARQQDVNPL